MQPSRFAAVDEVSYPGDTIQRWIRSGGDLDLVHRGVGRPDRGNQWARPWLARTGNADHVPRSRTTALLIAVVAAATTAGCANDLATSPRDANRPSPARSAAAIGGTPLVRLLPPSVVPGELSRRVLTLKDGHPVGETILRRAARAGQRYWVHAACTSATPGEALSVDVRSAEPGASDDALVIVEIPCDGTVTVDGLGELPAEPLIAAVEDGQIGPEARTALSDLVG
jgi:hypothetical protein